MNVGRHGRDAGRIRKGQEDMLKMTRAELHALVWSKPMTEIACEYGVRDQHVAKACDAHDIPRPRPGHWQRLAHGGALEPVGLDSRHLAPEAVIVIDPAALRVIRLLGGDDDLARRRTA